MQIRIENPADARLNVYRDLKRTNATRWSDHFVAEGDKLVDRLLDSPFAVQSLLVSPAYAERFAGRVPPDVPVFVVPQDWVEQIVGFNFHRGALACAQRRTLRALADAQLAPTGALTVVVCPDVQNPENLGAILRNSAAFGVDAVLLGPHCADPFSRRVLRVSMGAGLRLPIVEAASLEAELAALAGELACELWATVVQTDAEPLECLERPPRLALVFGSEGHGLNDCWRKACDRQVTIRMPAGTDSLNVAVAAGVFLYEVSRRTGDRSSNRPG